LECFSIRVTKESNGLLRLPLEILTSNPKDPPLSDALLDPGANCNIISNSRASDLQLFLCQEQGEIKFPIGGESVSKSVILTLRVTQGEISFVFTDKFYVIPNSSQELLLGRPTLNSTGLIHLFIGEFCSPNPLLPEINIHEIKIEDVDYPDADSEGEDPIESDPKLIAFDENTPCQWTEYASTIGCDINSLFTAMDWFARNSSQPISEFFVDISKILLQVPELYRMPPCSVRIERLPHKNAPYPEINKAIWVIQNALATVWDIANRGIAKFREMHIPFDEKNYIPVRVNAQNLNGPMSDALQKFLLAEEARGTVEDVPPEILATLTTISPMYMIPKSKPNTHRMIVDSNRSNVNKCSLKISGPAPDAQEHIDSISGHDLVFIADGDNFYFQLPVHVDSRKFTAFLTKFGIKQFTVLPQGHSNACSHVANVTIETLMFEKIHWKAYFDDFHSFADFIRKFEALYRLGEFHMYGIRYNVKLVLAMLLQNC
jgi:hypothetical protein